MGISFSGLQAMTRLVHQWVPMNRRSKNPIAVQSLWLDVSVGRQYTVEEVVSNVSEGTDLLVRAR